MPPIKATAKPIMIRPTEADLSGLDRIEAELRRRNGRRAPSRTLAIRWAIRELAQRVFIERASALAGEPCTDGPRTEPPDV